MPVIQLELDSTGAIKGLKQFDNEVDKTAKSLDNLNKQTSFSKLQDALGGLLTAFAAISAAAATAFTAVTSGVAAMSVKAASDMEEVQGKFDVVFDSMSSMAEGWAVTLQQSYGMSTIESKKFLSSVQDILVPMGMSRDMAGQFSFEVTKLATDLGSFNNMPTAKVMDDIQSALVGNYETMKKYGVVLNATKVEQEAMNLGMASTKEELTSAMKVQAAYSLIVQSSTDAIGDFERTQGSFANQMKIFKSTLSDIQVQIGQYLLPYATEWLVALNKWVSDQNNINAVIEGTVDVIQFLYNGLKGLQLAAYGLVAVFANAFDMIVNGVISVIKPLDMLLDGFERLGWIASNPLKELQQFTDDFAASASEGFNKIWVEIETANTKFDNFTAKTKAGKEEVKAFGEVGTVSLDIINQGLAQTSDQMVETTGKAMVLNSAIDQQVNEAYQLVDELYALSDAQSDVEANTIGATKAFDEQIAGMNSLTNATRQLSGEVQNLQAISAGGMGTALFSDNRGGGVIGPDEGETMNSYYDRLGVVGRVPGGGDTIWDGSEWVPYSEYSASSSSNVTINVNQQVSRSDIITIASEMERMQAR